VTEERRRAAKEFDEGVKSCFGQIRELCDSCVTFSSIQRQLDVAKWMRVRWGSAAEIESETVVFDTFTSEEDEAAPAAEKRGRDDGGGMFVRRPRAV